MFNILSYRRGMSLSLNTFLQEKITIFQTSLREKRTHLKRLRLLDFSDILIQPPLVSTEIRFFGRLLFWGGYYFLAVIIFGQFLFWGGYYFGVVIMTSDKKATYFDSPMEVLFCVNNVSVAVPYSPFNVMNSICQRYNIIYPRCKKNIEFPSYQVLIQ